MMTNNNRERYISASSAVKTTAPNDTGTISPVGMNNMVLGGGNWQVVGTCGQYGVAETIGMNNIGLLVTTWGRFQKVNSTTFTLDDGSGLLVKCTVPSGTFLDSEWQYVSVTGISSMYKLSQYPYPSVYPPLLLVRDITAITNVESVSIPGKPSGCMFPAINNTETYSTSGSTCSQDHPVEYSFNWGDGTSSPWSTSTSASHSWNAAGAMAVTVSARCQVNTGVSSTSDVLTVNVDDASGAVEITWDPAKYGHGQNIIEYQILRDNFDDGAKPIKVLSDASEIDAGRINLSSIYPTPPAVTYHSLNANPTTIAPTSATWTPPVDTGSGNGYGVTHTYKVRVLYKEETSASDGSTNSTKYCFSTVSNTIIATAIEKVATGDGVTPNYISHVPGQLDVNDLVSGNMNISWPYRLGADQYFVEVYKTDGATLVYTSPTIYETSAPVVLPNIVRTALATRLAAFTSTSSDTVFSWYVYARHSADTSQAWVKGEENRFQICAMPPSPPSF